VKILIFQIDAFTDRVFSGNPAAVCPLDEWPEEAVLQAIALENNLSETAFFVPRDEGYELRWFTPRAEVDLCGHATLAAAWVIFHEMHPGFEEILFTTRSGELTVTRENGFLVLDFPAQPAAPCRMPDALRRGLGREPGEVLSSVNYMAVYPEEDDVRSLKPDMAMLEELDLQGVIATAPGREADFVSRFFCPKYGVPEDPVTGSAHCALTPYWSKKLGKKELHARQISDRGGDLLCTDMGDRVRILGEAVKYLEGFICI
jgi:predicted PhzF superfamily epimerase YddE/YHI9